MDMNKSMGIFTAAVIIAAPMITANAVDRANGVPDVYVNGRMVMFSEQPAQIVGEGYTLVTARGVLESLGYDVEWNEDARTVDITSGTGDRTVTLTIDSDIMTVTANGAPIGEEEVIMDVPAQIMNDRTMIPLRAISEAFGCEVNWDDALYRVEINSTDTGFTPKSAVMEQIFDEDYDAEPYGNFDAYTTLNGVEYHVTSTAVDYVDPYFPSISYEITINGVQVAYNTGNYYHVCEVYLADPDPYDDSVILFVLPISDNDFKSVTAYKYSPSSGIQQLNFDYNGDGAPELLLEPGRRCENFELNGDGTFSLVTGTNSMGMWGLQKYFRLNANDILEFEQADTYKIRYWADGNNILTRYDPRTNTTTTLTYEDISSNIMYGTTSMQDYEMLAQGYYSCKQSYGDLRAGDYFRLVLDDNNGNVMFVTSTGREGWINVNALPTSGDERIRIGGFALALAG